MSRRSGIGLAVLLVAGLSTVGGCRERAVGISPGDSGLDGGGADAAADASLPDGGGPDAAPQGCVLQDSPTVILSEGRPAFAYSLERLSDEQYLLAGGVGWSHDLRARLFALGGDSLAVTGWTDLDGTMAYATLHAAQSYVVVADVSDNRTTLRWLTAPWSATPFQELHSYLLCEDCSPFFSAPIGGETKVAVAVEHHGVNQVMLILAELHWDGQITVSVASALPGAMPTLVPLADGLLLLYLEGGSLMAVRYDAWQVNPAFPARPVPLPGGEPAFGLSAAATPGRDGAYASLLFGQETPRGLMVLRLDSEASILGAAVAEGATMYGYESSTAVSRGLVGVAWGETYGLGEVGAHAAVFTEEDLSLVFGPARISPNINHSSSSYSVWATIAPHPEGFAEVWGSWQEDTYYGMYGMILRCAAPGPGPGSGP
ncbi:MAG: hypothetical protein RBU30_08605 [Polyangia bacterium]|nr:hypothetical protein [Polyangia bacterium]